MEDCIFCKIVKEGSQFKVWESEKYLGFLDIRPAQPGHTLVIPKRHIDPVFGMPDVEYADFFLEAKKVAAKLQKTLMPKRVGIIVEGFGVPHAHIHLIPINGLHEITAGGKETALVELQTIAEKING